MLGITTTDQWHAAVIGGTTACWSSGSTARFLGQMNSRHGFGSGGILLLLPSLILPCRSERVASQRASSAPPRLGGAARHAATGARPGFGVHGRRTAVRQHHRDGGHGGFRQLHAAVAVPHGVDLKHYDITVMGLWPLWTPAVPLPGRGRVLLLFFLDPACAASCAPVAKLVYLVSVLPVAQAGLVLGLSYICSSSRPLAASTRCMAAPR